VLSVCRWTRKCYVENYRVDPGEEKVRGVCVVVCDVVGDVGPDQGTE
jgi:hypothetical protein